MTSAELKKQIYKLPSGSGIYIFKNSKNKPLYIGKALNLKNRVGSYLKTGDPRLNKMILEAKKIDFIKTDSDIEALILESQYVKKYRPDFNIMLRDDKQYGFVSFTNERFPRIFITHQPGSRNSSSPQLSNLSRDKLHLEFSLPGKPAKTPNFIGPFTDIGALKITLRLLRKVLPYCTCKQLHNNYCLNYHIEKCPGFCCLKQQNPNLKLKNQNVKLYEKNIRAIRDILSGKKSSLIKNLEKEMQALSDKQKFEKALELQYKIEKLKRVFKNAQIIRSQITSNTDTLKELQDILKLQNRPNRIECYDIANIQGKHAVGVMVVFSAKGGPASGGTIISPDKNEYRKFKITTPMFGSSTPKHGGDTGMLKEIITRRFNHQEWAYPDLIIVDGGKGQLNAGMATAPKNTNIIALTKNEKHIGNKIITKNKEILLSKLPTNIKNLLLQIDSEAHRFAISYYRKIHRKSLQ